MRHWRLPESWDKIEGALAERGLGDREIVEAVGETDVVVVVVAVDDAAVVDEGVVAEAAAAAAADDGTTGAQ